MGGFFVPFIAASLLAGCVDERSSPVGANESGGSVDLTLASAGESPSGPDVVIEPRFDIELDVDGSLKPGLPIHFTVRGRAQYATEDAEVRLILPEVSAAKRSGWEIVEIPVGEEVAPEFRMRKGFAAGESFRERATVTIPEPGYYYALATVVQRSDDPRANADGHVIGTGAARELWLWIDERGGRVTERFDPTLFPEGLRRVRGPLGSERKPSRVRDGDAVITCALIPAAMTVSSTGCPPPPDTSLWVGQPPTPPSATAAVTVTYSDAGTGTTRPLADAWLAWRVTNTVTGAQVSSGGAYTTASGVSPTIDCIGPTTERGLQVTVHTRNPKAEVNSYISSNPDRTLAGQYFGSCGGTIPITADNQQAHLFINMSKNYDGHQRVFGSPPTVMKAGLYPISAYGSRYDWGADHVRIEPKWDNIWGEHAVMVAAHEWGHLWQDRYLFTPPATNGLKRYYNQACPNPHPPGQYTNFGCAFGEAFADWYAVVVRESDLPNWRRDLEENRLHLHFCDPRCTSDGSIVEGAIHAFLWDITDPAHVESHDKLQKPASQVVDAIRTCEVSIDRVEWRAYTGIDHLIWCMELRFPYQVRMVDYQGKELLTTFFDTRPSSQWVNDARGYSVANFSDDFRRLWLVNLYSRRDIVGTIPVFRNEEPVDPTPPPTYEPTDPSCGTERICAT